MAIDILPLYTSTPRRSAQGVVSDYSVDPSWKGMSVQPARTNRVTCRKANPVDTANLITSGDAAAVLSVVDDADALAAAGLSGICTSGKVYKLDNSAGSVEALAVPAGIVANTNSHSISAYHRGGSGGIRLGNPGTVKNTFTASTPYVRKTSNNITPGGTSSTFVLVADPGQIVYFILPQLEEGAFSTPTIVDPANDTLTTVTRAATVPSFTSAGRIREQNCAVWLKRNIAAAGQTAWAFASYTDTDNYTGILVEAATVTLRKRIAGTNHDATVAYTHAAGATDIQAAYTDKGLTIRASDDNGATWTAWAEDANTADAVIAATFQYALNGAQQLACNSARTMTAYLPPFSTLEQYQSYVSANANWGIV